MDAVVETRPGLAPQCALGRVASDPVRAQLLCEESAPRSQCGLPDVEALPVLDHRLDDQMRMRVILVRIHGQGIAMLEGELLPCETPAREKQLLGRRALRHREDYVVNEPRVAVDQPVLFDCEGEQTREAVAIWRLTEAPLRRYSLGRMISLVFLSFRGLPRVKVSAAQASHAFEPASAVISATLLPANRLDHQLS